MLCVCRMSRLIWLSISISIRLTFVDGHVCELMAWLSRMTKEIMGDSYIKRCRFWPMSRHVQKRRLISKHIFMFVHSDLAMALSCHNHRIGTGAMFCKIATLLETGLKEGTFLRHSSSLWVFCLRDKISGPGKKPVSVCSKSSSKTWHDPISWFRVYMSLREKSIDFFYRKILFTRLRQHHARSWRTYLSDFITESRCPWMMT